jgi:hypothetical protein
MHNPTAPILGPHQTWYRDTRLLAQQVEAVFPRFVDADKRDPSIDGTRNRQSGIAEAKRLRALPLGPIGRGPEVFPRDPTPIQQREDIPGLALHDQWGWQSQAMLIGHPSWEAITPAIVCLDSQ